MSSRPINTSNDQIRDEFLAMTGVSRPSASTPPEPFTKVYTRLSLPDLDNIPVELLGYTSFVCWREAPPRKPLAKPLKIPVSPLTGRNGHHDPQEWTSFETAVKFYTQNKSMAGIGFEFSETDPYAGIDLDKCRNPETGKIDQWAVELIRLLDSYSEISPSQTGVKIIVRGSIEGKEKHFTFGGHEVEIYKSGRYFTLTGRRLPETPTEIQERQDRIDRLVPNEPPYIAPTGPSIPRADDDSAKAVDAMPDAELMARIEQSRQGKKFKKLMAGSTDGYPGYFAASGALCAILATWTRCNPERIDRLYRKSGLFEEFWWDDRCYSGQRSRAEVTIAKSCSLATAGWMYDPRPNKTNGVVGQPSKDQLVFRLPAVEICTHRDYVIAPVSGQKDGWFPRGAVSLVGGPSGSSKTTWMLQLLINQAIKAPFYGHDTYGHPYLMLGADRGEDAHKRTMERMNLTLASVPFKPLPLAWDIGAAQAIVDQIEATEPLPEVVFIEGVDMLVTEVNNIKTVARFVHELQKIAQHYRIALIGSLGSPKAREGHGYTLTRDNLLGSGGWGRTVETVALLQFPKNDDTSGRRKLTVVLRNAPAEKFSLKFVDGLLEIDPDSHEEDERGEQASKDIEWYQEQAWLAKKDPAKKWWTVLDLERALNLGHATADRHVKHDHTKGHLVKKTRGKDQGPGRPAAEYRWNDSKTNPLWAEQQAQEQGEAF
jgi:putative DNA primase/helicase